MASSYSTDEKIKALHREIKASDIKPWWRRWLMYFAYHGILDLYGSMCASCKVPYPCATIEALGESPDQE